MGADHHPAALYCLGFGGAHGCKAAHQNRQEGDQQNHGFEFLQQISPPRLLHLWLKLLQYERYKILLRRTADPEYLELSVAQSLRYLYETVRRPVFQRASAPGV